SADAPAGGQRPGAWPAAAGAGAGGSGSSETARRPGGWPTASTPGRPPSPQAAAPAPTSASAQNASSRNASAQSASAQSASPGQNAAAGAQDMAQGASQVRAMWPDILEAVKNRRRFTWILLSQNAQVTGFDGTTLQIGFLSAGARDTFSSSGSEEVLKQALAEQFNATWRVDAVVDPSGGGGMPPQAGGGGGGRPPSPAPYQAPSAPQAAPYEPARPAPAQQPPPGQPTAQQPGRADQQLRDRPGYDRSAPEPPRAVAPEDDTAEADDPDLVDSALSGHDLIVRELGATVVEEFTNE
ncbi:DNA polymerase III subunit gamma and tau, partial [Streptomyces sp. NPDC005899]